MNRDNLNRQLSDAQTVAEIITALSEADTSGTYSSPPSFYTFLGWELTSRLEEIEKEVGRLPTVAPAEPPPMPPLTEEEVRLNVEITAGLTQAVDLLEQRNLDRAVRLAREAAEGKGALVAHFRELGRRFEPQSEQQKRDGA